MTRMIPLLWSLAFIALACFFVWALMPSAHAQNVHYSSALADQPVDLKRMASAIKAVENSPRNYVGYAEERSEYQITPAVWAEHSDAPHAWASRSDPVAMDETLKVVRKHLNWIVANLEKGGWTVSPYTIALVWKGGWGRWATYKPRFSDTQYALRALNVYSCSE